MVHAGTAEPRPVIDEKPGKIDVGLAGVEAGIDMGEAYRNEARSAQNEGGALEDHHGELHGRTFGAAKESQFPLLEMKRRHRMTSSRARRESDT